MIRIGVDVGGTNTDAVVLNGDQIIATSKRPTTSNISDGIIDAIQIALESVDSVNCSDVSYVMIGTTQFINAIGQRTRLEKVGVIRLGSNASWGCLPFSVFPDELREAVQGYQIVADGGYEITGAVIKPVNRSQIRKICDEIEALNIKNVVISGIFSPKNCFQELAVRDMVKEFIPDCSITISSDIGFLNLLGRENAAILNETLKPLANIVFDGYVSVLSSIGIECPLFITQNDGTLMNLSYARNFPVLTTSSGTTNSMRGAAFLSGIKNAIVVDVGGTTTDVGVLIDGFPRISSVDSELGGVQTFFQTPDVFSLSLGGGTIIGSDSKVGPLSVGYELTKKGLVFGGDTLTMTDIAICLKLRNTENIGDASLVRNVDLEFARNIHEKIQKMVEYAIDKVKISSDVLPILLVGGGGIIVDTSNLPGGTELVKHFDVANAVGAAIAQVSASIDTVVTLDDDESVRDAQIQDLVDKVMQQALDNGAKEGTVELITKEISKISYTAESCYSVLIKAVGDIDVDKSVDIEESEKYRQVLNEEIVDNEDFILFHQQPPTLVDCERDFEDEWILTAEDVKNISIGAGILGCGGGGSPYLGMIKVTELINRGAKIKIVPPSSLSEDDSVLPILWMGVPTAVVEKLYSLETINVINALREELDYKVTALIPGEIGGMNSLEPLYTAGLLGLPVVDADFMGRAYPRVIHFYHLHRGCSLTPVYRSNENGITLRITECGSIEDLESQLLATFFGEGLIGGVNLPALSKKEVSDFSMHHTLSQAWTLGNSIRESTNTEGSLSDKLKKIPQIHVLFTGKIINVLTDTTASGHNVGKFEVQSFENPEEIMTIIYVNEYLAAKVGSEYKCVVPDMICAIDMHTGDPITTETLRFGYRVIILGIPCDPKLRDEDIFSTFGPLCFGLDDALGVEELSGYKLPESYPNQS